MHGRVILALLFAGLVSIALSIPCTRAADDDVPATRPVHLPAGLDDDFEPSRGIPGDPAKALQRVLPEARFDAVSLADVLEFLGDVCGMNLVADWPALRSSGLTPTTPVTFRDYNVPVERVLRKLLAQKADYDHPHDVKIVGPVLFISTPEGLARIEEFDRKLAAAAAHGDVKGILDRNVSRFWTTGWDLEKTLKHLQRSTGVEVQMDWSAAEKVGIRKDSPVKLEVNEVPLSRALQLLLMGLSSGDVQFAFTVTKDRILITPSKTPHRD